MKRDNIKAKAQLVKELDTLRRQLTGLETVGDKNQHTLFQFLEAIPYGLFVVGREGICQFANRAAKNILAEEIFQAVSYDKMWQTHRAYYSGTNTIYPLNKMPISRALRGERATIDDIEIHLGERIIPLEVSAVPVHGKDGEVTHAIGIFQDITERKRARKALKESEEKYRRLLDNSLVGIYITQKHILQFCNQRFAEIFGYEKPEEILGKHMKILVAPQSWEMVDKEVNLRESGLKETSRYEFKGIKKDGTHFDIEVLGNRIVYHGKPAIQGTLMDITERKQSEMERQRLEDQLHQLQKMEAIGTLAGGIAHDFNNILSAIIGYTELAIFDIKGKSETTRKLAQVLGAADRARDMVKQILAFSRKGEKVQKPIMVSEILNEAVKLLRSTLPATIEIRSTTAEQLNPITANPTQIHQVIMNICTNAAYAMRESGGVLEILLKEIEFDYDSVNRNDLEPGRYQQLSFSDTGHGIGPDIRERIFEPYFTTKDGEGTGMGLAVVHGIVKNHGGDVSFYSEPGKGTTFNVFFPVALGKEIAGMEQLDQVPGGSERILYVDDELNLAEMGRQMLETLGYKVESRTSSVEALAAFRSDPARFALVITDQTMANMTGVQLARELRRIRDDIPIILCTGFSESVNEDNFRAQGINAFVMKPIVRNEIARVIREVLDCT